VNHSRTKRISRSSRVRSTNSCCRSTSVPSRLTGAVSASAVSPTLPAGEPFAAPRREPGVQSSALPAFHSLHGMPHSL
jgi:hypothetical protein